MSIGCHRIRKRATVASQLPELSAKLLDLACEQRIRRNLMPLSRRTLARMIGCILLTLAGPSYATVKVPKMRKRNVEVTGDGPKFLVDEAEAGRLVQVLRTVISDPEAVARSGAPLAMQQLLMRDYLAEPLALTERVRAGDWLLVSADTGPRWDLRMVDPSDGKVGLIFQVPIQKDKRGKWLATSVKFLRAW
jgi:hypothetical protein